MYRDVVELIEKAPGKLDLIMIPKVGTISDVYAVDMLCTQVEDAMGVEKRLGFELIIETALGMQNVNEIASYDRRLESLHFGVADYAASTKAKTTVIGGPNPNYHVLTDKDGDKEKDTGVYVASRCVQNGYSCKANGLRPIDGPFGILMILTAILLRLTDLLHLDVKENGQSILVK